MREELEDLGDRHARVAAVLELGPDDAAVLLAADERAVVHHVARAHAGAAVGLAREPTDLRLFDLAHHAGDDDVAFELDCGLPQHLHRDDVTGKSALHV